MHVIQKIEDILRNHPEVCYRTHENEISTVPEDGGFSVTLYLSEDDCTVFWGGWHKDFTDPKDAIACFLSGLTARCRLKVYFRGAYEYKWTAQIKKRSGWSDQGTTAFLFSPFWRKKTIVYFQNRAVKGLRANEPRRPGTPGKQ